VYRIWYNYVYHLPRIAKPGILKKCLGSAQLGSLWKKIV